MLLRKRKAKLETQLTKSPQLENRHGHGPARSVIKTVVTRSRPVRIRQSSRPRQMDDRARLQASVARGRIESELIAVRGLPPATLLFRS
jgi:hypothetical protein